MVTGFDRAAFIAKCSSSAALTWCCTAVRDTAPFRCHHSLRLGGDSEMTDVLFSWDHW
jgi:hypothetical protein